MKPFTRFVPLAAVLALAAVVEAADAPVSRVNELREVRDKLARSATETEGVRRDALVKERNRVDAMIEALEGGHRVDPAEIDRVLQRH